MSAELTTPNTVQFGFTSPLQFGGVIGAYFRTATFSGQRYSQVVGSIRIGGLSVGNPNTPSTPLLNYFNSNPGLLQGGKTILDALKLLNNFRCEDLF